MLRGMLLDIDGTLLLSNDAHAHAWVEAYRELGYDVPFEKIQPLIGMGGDKLMKTLTPELDESKGKGKEIAERRRQIFLQKYAPTLKPAPGVRELLLRLRREQLSVTVATSAGRHELDALLQATGIADLIDAATTSDDAEHSKPDPDIVQAALTSSGVDADEVLMLGDTAYDIEAASRVGIGVVAVRCGGSGDEELKGALAIYDDPADILAHFEESPIGVRLASGKKEAAAR